MKDKARLADISTTNACDAHILIYCSRSESFSQLICSLTRLATVTVATRWEVLQATINQNDFELVLIEMPHRENELFKLLAATNAAKKLNVILLDGSPAPEVIGRAFHAGVRDYFATPVDQELLWERIQYFLGQFGKA